MLRIAPTGVFLARHAGTRVRRVLMLDVLFCSVHGNVSGRQRVRSVQPTNVPRNYREVINVSRRNHQMISRDWIVQESGSWKRVPSALGGPGIACLN